MNFPVGTIGRKRFAAYYGGVLVLKVLAAALSAWALHKYSVAVRPILWIEFFQWTAFDLLLWKHYLQRMRDVDISPYCLLILYTGDSFWVSIFAFIYNLGFESSHTASGQGDEFVIALIDRLFSTAGMLTTGILSMVWILAIFMRVFPL
jgi:hypothetical protein